MIELFTYRPSIEGHRRGFKTLPVETLRQLLTCNPDTGELFWRARTKEMFPTARAANSWNTRYGGKRAFTSKDAHGYFQGELFNVAFKAHRVVWALVHGEWPVDQLDHINGDRADNRIANLRVVSGSENMRNARAPLTNTSGQVGVYWYKQYQKWSASIRTHDRKHFLGYFASFDDAVSARKTAEREHGFHPNHGRIA